MDKQTKDGCKQRETSEIKQARYMEAHKYTTIIIIQTDINKLKDMAERFRVTLSSITETLIHQVVLLHFNPIY